MYVFMCAVGVRWEGRLFKRWDRREKRGDTGKMSEERREEIKGNERRGK